MDADRQLSKAFAISSSFIYNFRQAPAQWYCPQQFKCDVHGFEQSPNSGMTNIQGELFDHRKN